MIDAINILHQPKTKRHRDAIAIANGACNPSGIALAIVDACREMRANPSIASTDQLCSDPAIRLMVHQLAFICDINVFDRDISAYGKALDECGGRS
jgi:hypothetical protein